MKIFISNSAFNDLEDIKQYYTDLSVPNVGEQYIIAIIDHIDTLSDNPEIGRIVPEFDEEKIRELIHPPFRIVYLKEKHTTHIIRVWRSERLLLLPKQEL